MPHRLIRDGDLFLYGVVGDEPFLMFDDPDTFRGFTDAEVITALSELSGDITVRLNSPGGITTQGIAIHNALKAHDGKVTVSVDGIAASIASIIAMGGEEIVMRDGAMMMIHNASGFTVGTSEDHQKSINALEANDASMAAIYAKRTGKSREEIRRLMDDETWMTAEEAVREKFATRAESSVRAIDPAAFDYRLYARAPERLVALSERLFNARTSRIPRAISPAQQPTKELTMSAETEKGGHQKPVELKALTVEQITAERPDIIEAVKAQARIEAEAEAKAAAEKAAEKAAAAAKAGNTETAEQIEARVRAEVHAKSLTQAADIIAACHLVGRVDKAMDFIRAQKSLSEVVAILQADRPKDEAISARHNVTPIDDAKAKESWDKVTARINAAA